MKTFIDRKKVMSDLSEIINSNKDVVTLIDLLKDFPTYHSVSLTGGAILDILKCEKPKDYDLTTNVPEDLMCYFFDRGAKLLYVSSTAITMKYEELQIQILKTSRNQFDFTINQGRFNLGKISNYNTTNQTRLSEFDYVSYLSEISIPTEHSFKNKVCTLRINKIKNKGFKVPSITKRAILKPSLLTKFKNVFSKNKGES